MIIPESILLVSIGFIAGSIITWIYGPSGYIVNRYRRQNKKLQDRIDECIIACDEANNILTDPRIQEVLNQIR